MHRIGELTGLRCAAVLMVVLGHARRSDPGDFSDWLWPLRLVDHGDAGVHIFFILSGFLITGLLKAEYARYGRINFPAFYLRRTLRILPAFVVFLLVVSILSATGQIAVSWRQITLAGTYLWNYGHLLGLDGANVAYPDGTWYLGHTWSLALEEQFYWIWPALFVFILWSSRQNILTALILGIPAVRIATYFLAPSLRGQLTMMAHTGMDSILVGCAFGFHRATFERRFGTYLRNPRILTALAVTVLLAIPNTVYFLGGLWSITWGRTFEAGLIGFMILAILAQPDHIVSRVLRAKFCVAIGTVSYSLYLWQQIFTAFPAENWQAFPIDIVEALAAASFSYVFIEKPILRLKDNLAWTKPRRAQVIEISDPLTDP